MVIKTEVTPEEYRRRTTHRQRSCAYNGVCKTTESSQIGDFMRRRQFAEKKISGLTEQEKRLKKDYHDLKFIEKHIRDTEYRIE